jgi:hypothetical protein
VTACTVALRALYPVTAASLSTLTDAGDQGVGARIWHPRRLPAHPHVDDIICNKLLNGCGSSPNAATPY